MTVSTIDEAALPHVAGANVAIVKSKWHSDLVNNMAAACKRVLTEHGVVAVHEFELPGTLEMPLAVKALAESATNYRAFVCLSVVEKGDTAHFDMIVHATTRALQQLSVDLKVPVINEILAVYDISDAIARASPDEFNKGIEAAAAALETMKFLDEIA